MDEYKEWLPVLLSEHPAALTVHLRTKKEMSKVSAHYELIPEIVKLRDEISPETKLIINGDIRDKAHAMSLHEQYPEVDGFMIGRGVFANPYCFTDYQPTREDLIKLLKLHLELYEEYANDYSRRRFARARRYGARSLVCSRCRKCSSNNHSHILPYEPLKHYFKIYINNFPGAGEIRAKLMETHSVEEAWKVVEDAGL